MALPLYVATGMRGASTPAQLHAFDLSDEEGGAVLRGWTEALFIPRLTLNARGARGAATPEVATDAAISCLPKSADMAAPGG